MPSIVTFELPGVTPILKPPPENGSGKFGTPWERMHAASASWSAEFVVVPLLFVEPQPASPATTSRPARAASHRAPVTGDPSHRRGSLARTQVTWDRPRWESRTPSRAGPGGWERSAEV